MSSADCASRSLPEDTELGRRDLHRLTGPAGRPDELPGLETLGVERHADPVMPDQLDQVAPAPAKAEDLACMRIAPEPLLHRQRQRVHAAPHVGDPARDPDAHPRREGDHRSSRTGRSRARTSGSTPEGTRSRRPFPSTISSCTSAVSRRATGAVAGTAAGGLGDSVSGMNAGPASVPSAPSRYCRRHIVSRERDTPCRRAVAAT